MPELFARSNVFGTFKGFSERGLEFAADIVAPYDATMLERPQLGQFLLIELGSKDEASLGRITKFVPSGLLATAEGEDYINTMQSRQQDVPEDLKKQKLKYKVQIKLLGAVKNLENKIVFVPSQRRLPHLGAMVALPSEDVLKELCTLSGGNTDLGDYVLGEFIYSGKDDIKENIFKNIKPELKVTFDIDKLVARRSVVFARAGYGKSNLIKFLVAELYRNGVPNTERGDKVGVLIFDADGEYFWPDFKNRPGLCDVEQLQENLVVFSSRTHPKSKYYNSWKAGDIKLDIRDLLPRDVIGITISPDRQNQQNIIKLKSLNPQNWRSLVDLITREGLGADNQIISNLLGYTGTNANDAEVNAAKSNMNNIVNHLHDPNSQLLNETLTALKEGYCVVVDISMLSSSAGYNIAGLLMRKIFNYNQENFTGASPIPVISIIEEAQSVLGKNLEESSPFVEWVKEGRKYDLGAILITQQPGSMSPELLSQADNWFCFHLLSEGDVSTLGKYNSHFSHDILAHLIAEPIRGNCYMWSAPEQPFVLPVKIRSFEAIYGKNVKTDENTPVFDKSPAKSIKEKAEKRDKAFAEALKVKLKEGTTSWKDFPDNIRGIFGSQLYVIISNLLKEPEFNDEFRKADQLKETILPYMLGCDVTIQDGEHPNKGMVKYHCAPKTNWDEALR